MVKDNNSRGFEGFGLSPRLLTNIAAAGFREPTPIQQKAIGPVLSGKDLVGLARTGTGKTAAFVLPLLQVLSTDIPTGHRAPRGLIIAPTRELAEQIHEAIQVLGKSMGLRTMAVFGGTSIHNQLKKLKKGVDLVVACPGRLLDLHNRKGISLDDVTHVVLDEADQMLDMGFFPDIRRIYGLLPEARQSLLFSATMPAAIEKLSRQFLRKPLRIESAPNRVTEQVDHSVFHVRPDGKNHLLQSLLKDSGASTLVFTRTKHRARKLAQMLQKKGEKSTSLHGNLTSNQRRSAVNGFKSGKYRIMVATDIAARGIDITGIEQVINYDFPVTPEIYVHRIGRTGRAAATGTAYTFVSPEDNRQVTRLEKLLKQKLKINSPVPS